MSAARKLFSNSVLSIAAKFLNAFLQIICLPVLLKVYGKEGYGLISIAMSFNMLISILQLGLPTGVPKFVAEWFAKKNHKVMQRATSSVFSFYLGLAFINFSLLLVIRCFFIDYFKISPAEIGVFRELLLITAIVSFISIPYNYLEQLLSGVQEIAFNAKMQMIKNVLFACLVFFVSFKPHSITLVQFYALNCFTMIAVIPWQVLRWLKYGSIKTFLPRWYFKETLPLFKYCLNLFVMGIFIIMADKLKPLILTLRVSGSASLKMADYQIIYNIILFLNMITSSFITVLIPYIAREYVMGNHGIYKKVIQETTKLVWGFGAFLIFTMITFSKEILLIYVGPNNVYLQKWLIFYLVGYLYVMYAPCISAVVLSSGRMLPYTVGTALGCVVSLIFCWFTVPISPMGGMVFSYIVYIIIIFFTVHFYYLPKMFNVEPIRQIFRVLIPPLVVGVCMVFLTRYFLRFLNIPNIYANTLIGTFVGFIVYIVMILIVYIKPKELRLLLNRLVPVRGNN